MSKTLKERLRHAAQESEKKKILKSISEEFSIDSNDIGFCEYDFDTVLLYLDGRSTETVELAVSDETFLIKFERFLKVLNTVGDVLFYVVTKDKYYFLKLPISFLKKNPDFFWKIKGTSHSISDCILVEENGRFGFVKLYTEYGYELYEWI